MRCLRLLVLLALVLPTAEADHLDLRVGRDLTVASIQDTGRAEGRQYDASVRVVGGYGFSISGSLGHGETDGDKAWVEEQTRLIGRESVNARVENHTQLDGAVIAADNGNLTLDTGTLAFSDLHDKDREKSYYANISLSYSGEQGDNPQQQQNNRQTNQPVRSGRQAGGGGGPGGTFSGYYRNHDRRQTNRATIGQGTILVRADQETGQDSTAGLNRDLARAREITRDEHDEINVYVSDSSVRSIAGMFKEDDPNTRENENTFGRWRDDFKNYARSTTQVYQTMGKLGNLETDSVFINSFSKIAKGLNTTVDGLGLITLGLVPGVENHGGIFGQVPALFLGDEFFYRVRAPLIIDSTTGKPTVDVAALQILGEVERPENNDYVSSNGVQNSLPEAILKGAMQTGAVEFVLPYNPEHGFLSDALETAWDLYLGGAVSSGNARQLRGFYQEGIDKNHSFNIAGHSQGALLNYRAMQGLDFTNDGVVGETGTVLFSGAPVDSGDFGSGSV